MTASLSSTSPFPVTIRFDSDWHIGSGTSRSRELDRSIMRDHEGLPFVPAKTLVGLLRERALQIATALDTVSGSDAWGAWHRFLFGTRPSESTANPGDHIRRAPIPAALKAEPLRLDDALRARLSGRYATGSALTAAELRAATTVVRASVRIAETTGTAMDEHLLFDERARAGLTVGARWSIDAPAGTDLWPAGLLLGSAARLVIAVGGKRRRGAGECTVVIADIDTKTLDALYKKARGDVPRPPRAGYAAPVPSGGHAYGSDLVHAHDLVLTVTSPLLVAAQTRGNTVTSGSYIPGAALLPVVLQTLAAESGIDTTALVRRGAIVVTTATIDVDGRRSVPWPRALARSKGDRVGGYVNQIFPHAFDPKLRAPADAYLVEGLDDPAVRVPLVEGIHAVIDPVAQRPTEQFGGPIVYRGIAPGTVLHAQVWLPPEVRLSSDALADVPISVGRSRKDDYGSVQISVVEPERDHVPRSVEAGGDVLVHLESDVVLTGSCGQPDPSVQALCTELGTRLGARLTLRPLDTSTAGAAIAFPVFTGEGRVESWQARWGLPRPTISVVTAGTVLVCTSADPIPAARIAEVVARGIGSRRAEGYGRIAVNPPILRNGMIPVKDAGPGPEAPLPAPPELSAAVTESARIVYTAAWRRRITEAALAKAHDRAIRERYLPRDATGAQLGALRRLALGLAVGTSPEDLRRWLDSMHTIERRRSLWANQHAHLTTLVSSRSDRRHPIWSILFDGDVDDTVEPDPALADRPTLGRLAAEAVSLLLIECVRAESKSGSVDGGVPVVAN